MRVTIRGWLRGIFTNFSFEIRGNSCIRSQCAPFYESKNGRGKGILPSHTQCSGHRVLCIGVRGVSTTGRNRQHKLIQQRLMLSSDYHTSAVKTKGLFTWRWGTPGRWGNPPFHIISYFILITFT